jgi:hypothetical protein
MGVNPAVFKTAALPIRLILLDVVKNWDKDSESSRKCQKKKR